MATNDLLPFGIGAGSNVVTPATWVTTTARGTGFQSGVAPSALVNTALRQANFVSAMIGQFIADTLAQNVQDNGNLATLEAQFIASIQASVGSVPQAALWHWGRDNGLTNAMTVPATPIITAYADGMVVATIPNHGNTTTTPNMSANGLAFTTIVHADGTAMAVGDIASNTLVAFQYDATAVVWRMIGGLTIPQTALLHYGADSGSANSLSVGSTVPSITAVSTGMQFTIKKGTAGNTGASTLSIAGTTAALTWGDGTAFSGGEWPANSDGQVVYDGNYRLLASPSPPAIVAQASQVHYGLDTGGVNSITSSVGPAITSYVTGSLYYIKIAATNTGSATANFNAIGSVPIVLNLTGSALSGNEMKGAIFHEFEYDGVSMRLMNSAATTAIPNILSFTTSGTYTPSIGIRAVRVKAWAAGGGGFTVTNGGGSAGDAAGAGEYREGTFVIPPTGTISYTIGAPGSGGSPGNNGGDTIFGSFLTAKGGHGATGALNTGLGAGGIGGSGGYGFPGTAGHNGYVGSGFIRGGEGGASFGSSASTSASFAPAPGIFPGGGGGGGNGGPVGGTQNQGGPGAGGLILIEELP